MRKRWEGQMHPVTKPIIFISFPLVVIWVLWVTVVTFFGGTIPIFGWEIRGGLIWGALSVACLWPVASMLFFAVFKALDDLAWRLDDKYYKLNDDKDLDHPS